MRITPGCLPQSATPLSTWIRCDTLVLTVSTLIRTALGRSPDFVPLYSTEDGPLLIGGLCAHHNNTELSCASISRQARRKKIHCDFVIPSPFTLSRTSALSYTLNGIHHAIHDYWMLALFSLAKFGSSRPSRLADLRSTRLHSQGLLGLSVPLVTRMAYELSTLPLCSCTYITKINLFYCQSRCENPISQLSARGRSPRLAL